MRESRMLGSVRVKPNGGTTRLTISRLSTLYIFKRDYAAAEAEFGRLFSSGDKNVRSHGRHVMALVPLNQGKLKETMRTLDDGIAADEMEGVAGQANAQKRFLKAFIYNEWGDPQSALREFGIWTGILSRIRPLDAVRGRHIYVRFLTDNGMMDEAEGVAEQLKRDIERLQPAKMGYYWSAMSFIERAKGNRRAAAAHMRSAMETRSWRDFPGLYFMGRSALEDGNLGEAVEYLESASSRYSMLRAGLGVWSVRVHYLLGKAYEESGWGEKAAAQYEEFLEVWKDADQGLPEVDDAKRRLARLRGET